MVNDVIPLNVLRVNKRPYIVYGSIYLFGFFLFIAFFFDGISQFWEVFAGLITYTIICGYMMAAFWFYRIELFEDVLIDKGLKRTKKAPVAAITKLKLEVGYGDQKWLWGPTLRPFRRLAVYYTVDNKQQSLDISLIHFDIQDVRELLIKLIKIRPDLEMPKNFPKQRKQQA